MWFMYGLMLQDSTIQLVNLLGALFYILYILTYFCYVIDKVTMHGSKDCTTRKIYLP